MENDTMCLCIIMCSVILFRNTLTRQVNRQGGRNDVSSKVLANCSAMLANRASVIDRVMDRKWAGPTRPRLYTTARESC